MFGDFEAQRHWVEVTSNLPVTEWYSASPRNNLTYWGLDYPPLTAFHSQIIGGASRQYLHRRYGVAEGNRRWEASFGLKKSHGSETPQTISLMRYAALWSELIIYYPACIFLVYLLYDYRKKRLGNHRRNLSMLHGCTAFSLAVLLAWGSASMIYIDHGHFQFNAVSLGLFMWSCNMLLLDAMRCAQDGPSGTFVYLGLSIVFYVASYCFKQMSLYYCLGFAAIFFGRCIRVVRERKRALWLLASLLFCLVTGVGSMVLVFYPFIQHGLTGDVLQRVFPVKRGLYEDKVANAWCCLSLLWKLPNAIRQFLGSTTPEEDVQRAVFMACAFATVVGSNPAIVGAITAAFDQPSNPKKLEEHCHHDASCTEHDHGINEATRPSAASPSAAVPLDDQEINSFVASLWTLLASSLSFYLFSFQVHEKSILLPAMPAAILLAVFMLTPTCDRSLGLTTWLWCFLFFSHLSLSQLAEKDNSILVFVLGLLIPGTCLIRHLFNRSLSWLRRLALCSLGLLLVEEGVSMTFLQGLKKYPHLPLMTRFSVCCFVFAATLGVASWNSFITVADGDSDKKKKD